MYEVTDKTGERINLKDEVKFTVIQDDMFNHGEESELSGIVVSLNSETSIQVQPEEGASFEVETSNVEVVSSIINEVRGLATTADMVALMEKAEARYKDELLNGTAKKKSGGSSKPKKAPAVTGTLTL